MKDELDFKGFVVSDWAAIENIPGDYKSDIIINHKMSQGRYLQAIARAPRLTIGMTLPLIEELLGSPHEKVISDKAIEKQQLWIYNLKDKNLHLSFKDFILFKIEEI